MTEYKDTLKCFIKRTNCNLKTIQNLSSNGEPPYEVTQLINSLLGLVVLPKEKLFREIPQTAFDDLRADGWPDSFLQPSSRKELPDNLRSLSICLRNGVAHFRIETTEQGGNISGVTICDMEPKKDSPHWKVHLTLDDLQCVIDRFGEVVKTHHP